MDKTKYDFSGYVTKNNVKCTDGRIILRDAFKDCDGKTVPLVWRHLHNDLDNILGHGLLENREDGVYGYFKTNDTEDGKKAKVLVMHGDLDSLSIYANQLIEKTKNVIHGVICEVSLVLAGANPAARIDKFSISHEDGSVEYEDSETEVTESTEAFIFMGSEIEKPVIEPVIESVVEHSAEDPTIGEIFDTFTEEQKNVTYIIVDKAVTAALEAVKPVADNTASHSDTTPTNLDSDQGENQVMKKNVFDSKEDVEVKNTLSHDQMQVILADAVKLGSLKESIMVHAVEYGIENVEYLFPDARTLTKEPTPITRKMAWVKSFMNQTNHQPFSRVKTVLADLTADEVRARGYVKGSMKTDAILKVLRRTTTPTMVYHKQKLDREDIVDITDFDVIAWMKKVGRAALDEEVARAGLIGDGREIESADRINEDCIRPIYKDDDMYVERVQVDASADAEDIMDAIIGAMEYYNGSGSIVMYTTTSFVTSMLLKRDDNGRKIYPTRSDIVSALSLSSLVDVPVMKSVDRVDDETQDTLNLIAILVDPSDYTFGADKGGEVNSWDQFDIDFNQQKTLSETRVSGALTLPKSAIVVEQVAPAL
jgi:hypothetical protein